MASDFTAPQDFTSVDSLTGSGARIISSDWYGTEGDIESHLRGNSAVLKEILNYIESIEYDCECGLSSGIGMLKRVMGETPKVQELIELCKDRAVAVFLLGHMLELTTRKIDTHYRNPWEIAMVTYLYAITQARTDLTLPATTIARRLVHSYWPERYITNYLS